MNRIILSAAACGCALFITGVALGGTPSDQVDESFLAHAKLGLHAHTHIFNHFASSVTNGAARLDSRASDFKSFGPPVANVDTVVNFQGSFREAGLDFNGNLVQTWQWAMVGNSPTVGGTTYVDSAIIPVSVRLLDVNGNQRYVNGKKLFLSANRVVEKVLNSPIFKNYLYSSSSEPTQFTDALMRAEFWSRMAPDWHTLLVPRVKMERVMSVPYGFYRFALDDEGECCRFILVDADEFASLLFPPTFPFDDSTVIGAAELDGDMTTTTIGTLLSADVFLYLNGDPSQCCAGGFHLFDYEPGVPENGNVQRAYVMNWAAAWVSPGIFPDTYDVVGLSHELSEVFNDPLVGAFSASGGACGAPGPVCLNETPWWLAPWSVAPNVFCSPLLEVGDVIEGLPNFNFLITMHGFTYHVQNEALLQWFEGRRHSDAIGGAFSYPDPSVLTQPSVSQQIGCTGPLHLDD